MAAAKKGAAKKAAEKDEAALVPSAREGSDVSASPPAGFEPIGPAATHEDHEGGETDTLARLGVRGVVPDTSAGSEAESGTPRSAPSYAERNPRVPLTSSLSASRKTLAADAEIQQDAAEEEAGEARVVEVKALRAGQWPASPSQKRRPDEVFNYTMGPGEKVLPSWLKATDGSVRHRRDGEGIDGEKLQATRTVTLEVPVGASIGVRGADVKAEKAKK